MKLDWVVGAEGIAQDARGAYTAVGLSQNVITSATLPTTVRRSVIAQVSGDPGEFREGSKVSLALRCISPSGKVLTASTNQGLIGESEWPELPPNALIGGDINMPVGEYGEHSISIELQFDDDPPLLGETKLYVMSPRDSG